MTAWRKTAEQGKNLMFSQTPLSAQKGERMKNVTIFYLEHCPYCKNAKRALASLLEEKPAYAEIGIHWVEESREPEIADRYDYYRVPSVFCGEEKLYEADPSETYDIIRQKLDEALGTVLRRMK